MIIKEKVQEGLEDLKEELGVLEDLREQKEFSKIDIVDTVEEIMRLYVDYLKESINK